jgi:hypothetical protein
MIIKKGETSNVSPNFTANELFSKSFDAPKEHYLNDNLITAAQLIRGWFKVPVQINSSFRTPKHNASVGGGKTSQHLKGNALDLSFPGNPQILELYNKEIEKRGNLFKAMRSVGINGLGLYDNFLHIDTRPRGGKQKDSSGSYAFWDKRIKKKNLNPTDIVNAWNDSEDGSNDFKKTKRVIVTLLVGLLILAAIIYYKKINS